MTVQTRHTIPKKKLKNKIGGAESPKESKNPMVRKISTVKATVNAKET
jgi:hypothetical protein